MGLPDSESAIRFTTGSVDSSAIWNIAWWYAALTLSCSVLDTAILGPPLTHHSVGLFVHMKLSDGLLTVQALGTH